jgi:hypothetical protein
MNNKLLIWTSTLVGLQVLSAGSGLTELVGAKVALAVCLGVAAAQAATTNYTRGVVVDAGEAEQDAQERVEHVEAAIVTRVASDGTVRAGEAADVPTGDVVPIAPDPVTGQPVPLAPVQPQLVA